MFSDLSPKEFRQNFLGLKKKGRLRRLRLPAAANKTLILLTNDLPTEFDWREKSAEPKIEVIWLNGDMVHDHIKTGYQEDGLAAIHGIKRERFVKRQTRFLECLKEYFSRLLNVGLYVNGNTVTAAGTSLEQVRVIRRIVERCYVENVSPAAIVSRLNMRLDINNAERQLRALLM
ncbi:hypothetical protein ACLB2K_044095 [Fragaria x ananassa]